MPIVHQPPMRAEQSLRHGLQPDILVPPMACLTPRRCDVPSIASPSDAADGLPRHRVADRACTASVGDSRQQLRTQSVSHGTSTGAVWQIGHKFGHRGVHCCAVALRPLGAAGRDTRNTRYQPLPLVLHSQQLQNVHGNTYLQLQVPITLFYCTPPPRRRLRRG